MEHDHDRLYKVYTTADAGVPDYWEAVQAKSHRHAAAAFVSDRDNEVNFTVREADGTCHYYSFCLVRSLTYIATATVGPAPALLGPMGIAYANDLVDDLQACVGESRPCGPGDEACAIAAIVVAAVHALSKALYDQRPGAARYAMAAQEAMELLFGTSGTRLPQVLGCFGVQLDDQGRLTATRTI